MESTVDSLIESLVSSRELWCGEYRGWTPDAIDALVEHWPYPLPPSYLSFLARIGEKGGDIFGGMDAYFAGHAELFELRRDSISLLAELGTWTDLREDAFVFAMHQGYVIYFFCTADGLTEPPVYCYVEGTQGPIQCAPSFTDYLNYGIKEMLASDCKWRHLGPSGSVHLP